MWIHIPRTGPRVGDLGGRCEGCHWKGDRGVVGSTPARQVGDPGFDSRAVPAFSVSPQLLHTDIIVLLLYFCWIHKPSAHVTMKEFDGKIIDIKATAEKLGDKCLHLLATHALSGCDSVSYPFGKGKVTAINLALNSKVTLREFQIPWLQKKYRLKKVSASYQAYMEEQGQHLLQI